MKKILSVFVFFVILAGVSYAKDKESMSCTVNLSEVAPKMIFLQNNEPKYADQAETRVDITRQVRKLLGRLPIAGDSITIIYEGSFVDYVAMTGRDIFIGLIDDSEQAGWYKELSEYTAFSDLVSQNEQFSTSVTLVVTQKPVTKCVLNIGFHTTPELAKKKPKLIATVKVAEEKAVEAAPAKETEATENTSTETAAAAAPAKSWSNMMNVALSFPQTVYTITEMNDTPIEKVDAHISTFDTHYAWLPTHKSGLTFKLGMEYGMGFVHPAKDGDKAPFVKTDVELLAGAGFTFGKDKFRFRILGEAGFGTMAYNNTTYSSIYGYTIKAETNSSIIYVPVGVDLSVNIFFGNYNAVGLYIGGSFHAIPMMHSSASTVTKMISGTTTSSSTSINIYTISSPLRFTPAIGVILTL